MFDLVGNDVMARHRSDIRAGRRRVGPPRAPEVVRPWVVWDRRPAQDGHATTRVAKPLADPEVAALIESTARSAGIERRVISKRRDRRPLRPPSTRQ